MYLPLFHLHPQDELIGVTFLYPDSLEYLLDIRETMPLIAYAGKETGMISFDAVIRLLHYYPNRLKDAIKSYCI